MPEGRRSDPLVFVGVPVAEGNVDVGGLTVDWAHGPDLSAQRTEEGTTEGGCDNSVDKTRSTFYRTKEGIADEEVLAIGRHG